MRIISGIFKGRRLKTLPEANYRPAMSKVRQALFSMLESRIGSLQNLRILDLYAGTASLAFEALSRGAHLAICVEKDGTVAKTIAENAKSLGLEPSRLRIITEEVIRFLSRKHEEKYDIVFIDPPYILDIFPGILEQLVKNRWLADNAIVCAEVDNHASIHERTLLPEEFSRETDKAYGQTRIIILKSGEKNGAGRE